MTDADARFRELVSARWASLVRTAFLLTGDRATAEDLVQTALTKSYVAWPRLRDPAAVEGYVRRTMITTYTSWWRRSRRERPVDVLPERDAGTRGDAGGDQLETVLSRSVLWPALHALPRGQRAVIVLRFYEDLTEAQTAQYLGCSVGTVKSQASRGLRTLRHRLGRELGRDDVAPSRVEGVGR